MLQTHYRQPIDWTVSLLQQSRSRFENWRNFATERTRSRLNHVLFDELVEALADDINTPAAFAIVDRVVASASPTDRERYTVYKFLKTLGLKGGRSRVSILADNVSAVANTIAKISDNDWENIGAGIRQKPMLSSGNPKAASRLLALLAVLKDRLDHIEPVIRHATQIADISQLKDQLTARSNVNDSKFDQYVRARIAQRNLARAKKDWAESDRIRDELIAKGVILKDSKEGTTWEKVR